VSLEDMSDSHRLLAGRFEIGRDIELWIHHSAASCARSAEQVAGAAGLRRQEVAKDHGALLCVLALSYAPPCYRVQYDLWNPSIGKTRNDAPAARSLSRGCA
jgi:hypothetical protein